MKIYEQITKLELEKDALIADAAARGNDKFEVIFWLTYKKNLAKIQAELDELYQRATEGETEYVVRY